MAIAYRAAGTVSTANAANMAPGLPSGWAADDIMLLFGVDENGGTLAASGWTQLQTGNNNQGGVNLQGTLLWRRAVGGDTTPTVTGAAGGAICRIIAFSGCETSGSPFSASSIKVDANFNVASVTATGITPGAASDMIVFMGGSEAGLTTVTYSGYSGTNPTFTEATDNTSSLGANFQGLFSAYGSSGDGSSTGDRTATCSTGTFINHFGILAALKEPAGGASKVPLFMHQYRTRRNQ